MEKITISKNQEVKQGERLLLTYDILSFGEWLYSIFDKQVMDDKIDKAIKGIKDGSSAGGYSVIGIDVDREKKKMYVDVRITDVAKVNSKGLGLDPATITIAYAVVQLMIVIAVGVGLSMSLSKVEKIVEKPIPALALVFGGVIVAYFWLRGKK